MTLKAHHACYHWFLVIGVSTTTTTTFIMNEGNSFMMKIVVVVVKALVSIKWIEDILLIECFFVTLSLLPALACSSLY